MKTSRTKTTLRNVCGLPYVEIVGVPVERNDDLGTGIRADILARVEAQIARALLVEEVPLRGLEIRFFRAVLGLSQRRFGELFGLSDVAILKWERSRARRLSRVNEIAVRAILAARFGIRIEGDLLTGGESTPRRLVLEYEGLGRVA
jgi:DNA-binding transcriptional regulator YiaG